MSMNRQSSSPFRRDGRLWPRESRARPDERAIPARLWGPVRRPNWPFDVPIFGVDREERLDQLDQARVRAELAALLAPEGRHGQFCMPGPLADLCRVLTRAHLSPAGLRLILAEADEVPLDPRRARLVHRAVAHLVGCAARHVFDDGAGLVRLEVKLLHGFVVCTVTDDGHLVASGWTKEARLMDDLALELQGAWKVHSSLFRTAAVLTFPLKPAQDVAERGGAWTRNRSRRRSWA